MHNAWALFTFTHMYRSCCWFHFNFLSNFPLLSFTIACTSVSQDCICLAFSLKPCSVCNCTMVWNYFWSSILVFNWGGMNWSHVGLRTRELGQVAFLFCFHNTFMALLSRGHVVVSSMLKFRQCQLEKQMQAMLPRLHSWNVNRCLGH